MGSFRGSQKLGRDNSLLEDANKLGQEWQVLDRYVDVSSYASCFFLFVACLTYYQTYFYSKASPSSSRTRNASLSSRKSATSPTLALQSSVVSPELKSLRKMLRMPEPAGMGIRRRTAWLMLWLLTIWRWLTVSAIKKRPRKVYVTSERRKTRQ